MSGTVARLRYTDHGPYELQVSDAGAVLAERAVSEHAAGTGAWDRGLEDLGFVRVGRWRPYGGGQGWECRVAGKTGT